MSVVPFKREHLERMTVQKQQLGLEELLTDEMYRGLEQSMTYTIIDGAEVLVCGGAVEVCYGRALCWAYISQNIGSRMFRATKAAKRLLAALPYRRIEADIDCDFEQGHRWIKMLGFTMECERRVSFTPDGRDCALYALVKG